MLPGESEFGKAIISQLALELALGYELVDACISILTQRHPIEPPSPDEIIAYGVGHALCIKACKTHRSILHLAEIGASHDANVLARMLFETAVAVIFVLHPSVKFGIKGFSDKELTSELRARLYVAFGPIQTRRDLRRHTDDPRFTEVLAAVNRGRVLDAAAEAERDIGPFWVQRLSKKPYTYSGFNLKELSDKLDPDLSRWYAGVYWQQSKPTHALDASKHVQVAAEGRMMAKWHSSIPDMHNVLVATNALLVRCFMELHSRFHFEKNPSTEMETSTELELIVAILARLEKRF